MAITSRPMTDRPNPPPNAEPRLRRVPLRLRPAWEAPRDLGHADRDFQDAHGVRGGGEVELAPAVNGPVRIDAGIIGGFEEARHEFLARKLITEEAAS